MACSVSKNSNSTASLRAKQLQPNFQRFCQMKLTKKFILRKLPRLIKMQKRFVPETQCLASKACTIVNIKSSQYKPIF